MITLPPDLVSLPQWVHWRWETRDGKPTKPPYRPDGRGRASSTDPASWASYEVAVTNVPRDGGLGFVFSDTDGFVGLDLDHCRDPRTAEIDEWSATVVRALDSYTEISPSGSGLHVILIGRLPEDCPHKMFVPSGRQGAAIEVYDRGRYLTVTGERVPDLPDRPQERQEELNSLLARLGPQSAPTPPDLERCAQTALAAHEVVERARRAKNGPKFERLMAGDTGGYASESEADHALASLLAFWTQDSAVILEVIRQSGLWDRKWERADYQRRTIARALSGCGEAYSANTLRLPTGRFSQVQGPMALSGGEVVQMPNPAREGVPTVICTNRPLSVKADEALEHLIAANQPPAVFVRNRQLVRVGRTQTTPQLPDTAVIEDLGEAALREALDRAAHFLEVRGGEDRRQTTIVSPPLDVVRAIAARGEWDQVPPLSGIVESPVVRVDGSLLTEPGYDEPTWLHYSPPQGFELPQTPEQPTPVDVQRAVELIDEGLADFPFADQASRANAYALLLTPIVMHALPPDSRVPVAVLDATTPGTGKGLLLDYTAVIATGHDAPKNGAPGTDEELDKRLLSAMLCGQSYFVLDNVEHILDFPSLDRTVTSGTYQGRLLGASQVITGRPRWTWAITGNNVKVAGDLGRRCYWIRLESQVPDPSQRPAAAFQHPDLMAWARRNRPELVAAALTMVRAWYADGRPQAQVPVFGSFEGWTQMVGSILDHTGIQGFLENRQRMRQESDDRQEEWGDFLHAWWSVVGAEAVSAGELARRLLQGPSYASLKDALPGQLAKHFDKARVDSHKSFDTSLGYHLGRIRGRWFEGQPTLRVERIEDRYHNQLVWRVNEAATDSPELRRLKASDSGFGTSEPFAPSRSRRGSEEVPKDVWRQTEAGGEPPTVTAIGTSSGPCRNLNEPKVPNDKTAGLSSGSEERRTIRDLRDLDPSSTRVRGSAYACSAHAPARGGPEVPKVPKSPCGSFSADHVADTLDFPGAPDDREAPNDSCTREARGQPPSRSGSPEDADGMPDSGPRPPLADRIAELLRAGPVAYGNLAKRLQVDELDVIDSARLDPSRRFMRAGDGVIALRAGNGSVGRGP